MAQQPAVDLISMHKTGQTFEGAVSLKEIELSLNMISVQGTALDPQLAISPIDDKILSVGEAAAELQALVDLAKMLETSQ